MARPLHFVYPGAVYHVMARGDGGRNGFRVFFDGLVILPKGELAQWPLKREDRPEVTGEENQKRYYHELSAWADKMNITTLFFEAFDENWKGDPNDPLGAERHWGLFTVDRKPKRVMQQ